MQTPITPREFGCAQHAAGVGRKQFSTQLSLQGWNDEQQAEAQKAYEECTLSNRRKIGTLLLVVGSLLCVFGFLITMVLLQHEVNFNLALYGATGLGGAMLLGGLVAIMG